MPSYYVGNIPVGGNDIFHYGVKGMRWGVVNEIKEKIGVNARNRYESALGKARSWGTDASKWRADQRAYSRAGAMYRSRAAANYNAQKYYSKKNHEISDHLDAIRNGSHVSSGGQTSKASYGKARGGNGLSPDVLSESIKKNQIDGMRRTYKYYDRQLGTTSLAAEAALRAGAGYESAADRIAGEAEAKGYWADHDFNKSMGYYSEAMAAKKKYEQTPLGKLEKAYKRQVLYGKSFVTKLRLNRVNRKKGGRK